MSETLKRSIIYFAIGVFLFGSGYFFGKCGHDVSSDGLGIDGAVGNIQSAQQQAEGATEALNRAGQANRNAADTAGDIAEGNRDIEAINGSIADLIDRGESIIARIRSRSEEGA